MSGGCGRSGPLPWCIALVMKGWGQRDEVGELSRGEAGHGLGDGDEVVLVGPTGGEADHDAAGSDQDLGRDFDQPRAPRFDVTFAERVAMTLEEAAAAVGFGGEIVRFGQLVRRELPGHRRVIPHAGESDACLDCSPVAPPTGRLVGGATRLQ